MKKSKTNFVGQIRYNYTKSGNIIYILECVSTGYSRQGKEILEIYYEDYHHRGSRFQHYMGPEDFESFNKDIDYVITQRYLDLRKSANNHIKELEQELLKNKIYLEDLAKECDVEKLREKYPEEFV